MKHDVIIGIDPAFRKGGFWIAIVDYSERSIVFRPFNGVLAFDRWLQSPDAPEKALVCIENSNLQNVNFKTSPNVRKTARMGRNVGANQAVSQMTVQAAIDRYGPHSVVEISPAEKGAKWNSRQFQAVASDEALTLYNFQDNQDARDAAKVALVGRTKAKIYPCSR